MVELECLTWVPSLWYEMQLLYRFLSLLNSPVVRHIPDDIIVNILSRLPANCVMQCRRVSKKWCALTSSSYFVELHLKRGAIATPPSLFLNWLDRLDSAEVKNPKWLDFYVYDDQRKERIVAKVRTQKYWDKMAKFEPVVLGSCDGLLLFISQYIIRPSRYKAFVLNPVTQELVVLDARFHISPPCGIYRDPSTREYKVLLSNYVGDVGTYYRVTLKSMQCERIMHTDSFKILLLYPCAVALNGSLHWMVERTGLVKDHCRIGILVFSTQHENFHISPHPGSNKSYCRKWHEHMQLLGTTEHLWLFNVLYGEIHVWVLRDYDSWAWDMRYTVNLKWNLWKFPYFQNDELCGYSYIPCAVRIVGIRNGVELLIGWIFRGMFWYNLEDNTVSRASIFKKKASSQHFHHRLCCSAYIKTLVCINSSNGE